MKFECSTLFIDVQKSALFKDSKTFADAIPNVSWQHAEEGYLACKPKNKAELTRFIASQFSFAANCELDELHGIESVQDYITALWTRLQRPAMTQDEGSLLALPHSYIVPGGRFNEIYYWDSYFTALGLEDRGDIEQIEAMVDNFIDLIARFDCVPNGNRLYYTSRSQPPVLSLMVEMLLPYKKQDHEWLLKVTNAMKAEHDFWHKGEALLNAKYTSHKRVVRVNEAVILNRFWDDNATPRPESYKEDVQLAAQLSEPEKGHFYRNIRAACESGWDFSARWLDDGVNLSTINTTNRIPIDLNCLLYKLETMISTCCSALGERNLSAEFEMRALQRKLAINELLWCDTSRFYFDFDLPCEQLSPVLSLASCVPLFTGICDATQAKYIADRLASDFLKEGGLVSCLSETEEQWDSPNGWAPQQWFAVKGLLDYGHNALADKIRLRWITMIEMDFKSRGCLLEKYNVVSPNQTAGGGEYQVQQGFGWTNGVTSRFYNLSK
ncbi:alpha,alpha-trehalase [Pseudoalteromonas citrea]|uniref:Alpha,alpha-trehalase n=1 Tax=Pseudoalteromonas citrea TaxID=43655 RepID=A0A5S3XU84_9GAMM|nr:trehalase family glycosidase [Pseudoalteromonas citrea]TMP42869.1 alpha,alpha-trehalase [Pseudoalteromonas citrea]TMP61043.1 alpha,alpha-trehalase [Pseudoalteromonas citrea]